MSPLLASLLKQVENLSYEERLELIRAVAQKLKMQQTIPQRKVNEFRGIVQHPFFGEDAQAWISRTRQEGDDRREQVLRGQL
jgi:hypothetical protein